MCIIGVSNRINHKEIAWKGKSFAEGSAEKQRSRDLADHTGGKHYKTLIQKFFTKHDG